jgi:hypothetical protein
MTPDGNPELVGNLVGGQAIYEYRPIKSAYVATSLVYRYGLVYQYGPTDNVIATRELEDLNPQLRVGYTFSKETTVRRLTFFTGIGTRYRAEEVTVGSSSVKFTYNEFYVPLGALFEKKFGRYFSLGCNFQWMPQVYPVVKIKPLDGAWWDLVYQIGNYSVEVPIKFSTEDDRYALSFSPYYEIWYDGASTAETLTGLSLALPGNKYIFTGLNVNIGISF